MSLSLSALNMKQLVEVLKDLKGGSIGFDPFRDERTKTKAGLLYYIASNFKDDAIMASVAKVSGQSSQQSDNEPKVEIPAVESLVEAQAAKAEAPKPVKQAPKEVPNTDQLDAAQQMAQLLAKMAGKPAMDTDAVQRMIDRAFEDNNDVLRKSFDDAMAEHIAKLNVPVRVVIENKQTSETKNLGVCHEKFPLLLKVLNARTLDGHRLNVWLKGPAGSGKTTACEKAAEALGLPFAFTGAIETKYDLIGFIDAAGKYQRTQFRDKFEHGGVFLFDEIDASNPAAVNCFNAATANGIMAFPDGIVKRHKDCVLIAGANTTGQGATAEYVGRFKQDAAAIDRYVQIEWNVDEKLERALSINADWTARVQKLRDRVESRKVKGHMITPRASFYGAALLAAGVDMSEVETMVLRKGLSQEVWGQLCQ